MIRRLAIIAAGSVFALPAIPEPDPQSARAWRTDAAIVFAPMRLSENASSRRRPVRSKLGPDPSIVAMVDRAAVEAGVPISIMRFHVARESSYRPTARNPKSTATGLLQVIRGTHEAIVGRRMTLEEHVRLMSEPRYALRVGATHIRACIDLMPGASAARLWRNCHVRGHASVGGRIEMAAAYYRPDPGGWLTRGSVAMPWATTSIRGQS